MTIERFWLALFGSQIVIRYWIMKWWNELELNWKCDDIWFARIHANSDDERLLEWLNQRLCRNEEARVSPHYPRKKTAQKPSIRFSELMNNSLVIGSLSQHPNTNLSAATLIKRYCHTLYISIPISKALRRPALFYNTKPLPNTNRPCHSKCMRDLNWF